MEPYLEDPDFTLYIGNAIDILRELPGESVHMCVTSPPYWGLRSYNTAPQIWDGFASCEHRWGCTQRTPRQKRGVSGTGGNRHSTLADAEQGVGQGDAGQFCQGCRAWRGELGLEPDPDLYIRHLLTIFRELRRVLRRDGTLWINIGDSYFGDSPARANSAEAFSETWDPEMTASRGGARRSAARYGDLKPKDLVGIPWLLAFALRRDGWYLRSDVIWQKPNPLPESVTDRPTKSHEYVFMLSRGPRYFYDADAIREPHQGTRWGGSVITQPPTTKYAQASSDGFSGAAESLSRPGREWNVWPEGGRNKRSVWEIPTESYPGSHFAVMPEALVTECIKAGCPEGGTVIDPFCGSGTTALVARRLGRKTIGVELHPQFADLCAQRLQQLSLLA